MDEVKMDKTSNIETAKRLGAFGLQPFRPTTAMPQELNLDGSRQHWNQKSSTLMSHQQNTRLFHPYSKAKPLPTCYS